MQPTSNPFKQSAVLHWDYPKPKRARLATRRHSRARNKAYLFLGANDDGYNVMVKLGDALAEANELASKEPERYKVGLHGLDDGHVSP